MTLKAGWKPVTKLNQKLWDQVLKEIKLEPGPWAAWKAMKADKLYIERGGKFGARDTKTN